MTNSAVDVRDLCVARSGRPVLRDLTFEIPTGCVTGLLGPSGCGKTTLIRTIAGTQRSASGTVRVLGEPAGTPALRSQVAYAAQTAAVYGDLTVAENVQYFASVLGAPDADVDRVIAAVDLRREAGQLVSRTSGGQSSRVSLAIALLGAPRLLLLDEPTVGLDPVLREELWRLFRSLAADGLTLLVSSHVMDEAARCDNLLLMRDGELLTTITPAGLRERTGCDDMEQAFLALIRESERSAA